MCQPANASPPCLLTPCRRWIAQARQPPGALRYHKARFVTRIETLLLQDGLDEHFRGKGAKAFHANFLELWDKVSADLEVTSTSRWLPGGMPLQSFDDRKSSNHVCGLPHFATIRLAAGGAGGRNG